jgi:hypothetical protein
MSSPRNRLTQLVACAAIALFVLDGWAFWQWASGQEALESAQVELAADNRLANSIRTLRAKPAKLESTARSAESLAQLIETSAQKVGLGTDHIVHVAPSEPRRLGNTPYLEQSTAVELRAVSLKQVVDLTQAVSQAAPRLTVPSISIRVPPSDANPAATTELWNVELTLTGHLYEPKIPAPP